MYLNYREIEYGFRITIERNTGVDFQRVMRLNKRATTIVLVIDSKRCCASICFYRFKDNRKYDIDPVAICEYLNTTDKEKEPLLSTDPKDQPAALELFNHQSKRKVDNSIQDELEIHRQH